MLSGLIVEEFYLILTYRLCHLVLYISPNCRCVLRIVYNHRGFDALYFCSLTSDLDLLKLFNMIS